MPIPTQIVSSDEYLPAPQTEQQREVRRALEQGGALAGSCDEPAAVLPDAGRMAASYLVMNQVYGPLFAVSEAEAATPELAAGARRDAEGPEVFDAHTHFLSDDPSPAFVDPARIGNLMWQRGLMTRLGWNRDLAGREARPTISRSTTTSRRSTSTATPRWRCSAMRRRRPADWLLPQEQVFGPATG